MKYTGASGVSDNGFPVTGEAIYDIDSNENIVVMAGVISGHGAEWQGQLISGSSDGLVIALEKETGELSNAIIFDSGEAAYSSHAQEQFVGVDVENDGTVYVNGLLPKVAESGVNSDILVAKFAPNESVPDWQRIIGGSFKDESYSISVVDDHLYVVGLTRSQDVSGFSPGCPTPNTGSGFLVGLDSNTGMAVSASFLDDALCAYSTWTYIASVESNASGMIVFAGYTNGDIGGIGSTESKEVSGVHGSYSVEGIQWIKYTDSGETDKSRSFNKAVAYANSGDIYVGGMNMNSSDDTSAFLVKVGPEGESK